VGPIKINLEIISTEVSSIYKLKNDQNCQVKEGGGMSVIFFYFDLFEKLFSQIDS
jgi:hypothetical protein